MVRLDRRRPAPAARFDHIGVERALNQEVGAGELGRLLLEHADELGADQLALGLGLAHPDEAGQEALLRVDGNQRHLEGVAEGRNDLLALALAHQAVIDEHAGQLVADRAVHEQRRDGGVDAPGEAADRPPVADLGADPRDLLIDDRSRAPAAVGAADLLEERRQDLLAERRVGDLGVELDRVDPALGRLKGRHRRGRRGGELSEARGRAPDGIAVRHPAGLLVRQAAQQAPLLAHGQLGAAELAHRGALDEPPE